MFELLRSLLGAPEFVYVMCLRNCIWTRVCSNDLSHKVRWNFSFRSQVHYDSGHNSASFQWVPSILPPMYKVSGREIDH